jgi:hypothetical protein
VLFSAAALEEVAAALSAQPNGDELAVYFHHADGWSRDLDADEDLQLTRVRSS